MKCSFRGMFCGPGVYKCIRFRVTDATELFRNDLKPCAGVFAKLLMTQFTSKEVMSYECPLSEREFSIDTRSVHCQRFVTFLGASFTSNSVRLGTVRRGLRFSSLSGED